MLSNMILTGRRYSSIDLIKGICILLVIFTHYTWDNYEQLRFLFPFWVDMAVPVFMIISGYVYAKSYLKHDVSIEDAYSMRFVSDKIIRYTIPYLIAFSIEEIAFGLLGTVEISLIQIGYSFLSGGIGPGSYYYPVMMQFIFWFPVIYFIIKKYKSYGFLICGFINFIYELLKWAYGMNEGCYRLLLFRYTLVIAFGCYMAIEANSIKKSFLYFGMMIGIVYIILFRYIGLTPLITTYWTGTSFFACLYILPITLMMMSSGIHFKPLELLGRASYNIFLTQMVYFKCTKFVGFVYEIIPDRPFRVLFNFIICSVVGVIFYYIEYPITKKAKALLL